MITFHDATADGHKRILKAVWENDGDFSASVFGPPIDPPEGVDQWAVYEQFVKGDAVCKVLSPDGD